MHAQQQPIAPDQIHGIKGGVVGGEGRVGVFGGTNHLVGWFGTGA